MQRKSHMLEDSKEDHLPRRAPYRRRRWQIGMFLFLIANIVGSTIQITTLPLPLLSTLQASGLVFNSILATLLLKEPWTWRTGLGTMLVVAGAFLISWFSALPEPSHNLDQLIQLLWKRGFLIWFLLSLAFTVAVLCMTFFQQYCIPSHRRQSARVGLIRGMSYGLISGILSAHALLLAKSAVELAVRSISDKVNQFSNYRSWLLLLAFLFLALTQLYYLHRGLKLVSTSILYPFVFCIYNIVAILDGLIYFRQTDRLPPVHAGLIALGTVVLLAGVLALSWFQETETDQSVGPSGEPHQHMVKSEIPQTVLVPGMGFVGDPEDETTNESAIASDEEYESLDTHDADGPSESSALLTGAASRDGRQRSVSARRKSVSSDHPVRRRKRASTLKEIRDIWSHPSDSENDSLPRYGTFDFGAGDYAQVEQHHHRSASARRPLDTAALQNKVRKTRRRSVGHVPREALEQTMVKDGDGSLDLDPSSPLQKSSTMPAPVGHQHGARRRRTSAASMNRPRHSSGGALFADLLRMEWWRARHPRRPHRSRQTSERYVCGTNSDIDEEAVMTAPTNGRPGSSARAVRFARQSTEETESAIDTISRTDVKHDLGGDQSQGGTDHGMSDKRADGD